MVNSIKNLYDLTIASNAEGLLEKELKQRAVENAPTGSKYKKRTRSTLSTADIEEIIKAWTTESKDQIEIAKQFRVSPTLVH